MRNWRKPLLAAWFCGLAIGGLPAQDGPRTVVQDQEGHASTKSGQADSKLATGAATRRGRQRSSLPGLTADERLAVIASALDSKTPRYAERDCSHLVHAIYERAGFPYAYQSSDDLYDGVEGFQRVWQPRTGDLVVWRGHAGIVVRPSRHVFFSFLRSGPGTDDYRSQYWKSRGEPRFYRYLKNSACAGCTVARGRTSQ